MSIIRQLTEAEADSIPARINSLIVDNAAQTVLLNEIRAAKWAIALA